MKLSDIEVNDVVYIKKLPDCEEFCLRLKEIGLDKNTKIKCVLKPIFKSPILFSFKGSLVSIRRSDAKMIEVEYE